MISYDLLSTQPVLILPEHDGLLTVLAVMRNAVCRERGGELW